MYTEYPNCEALALKFTASHGVAYDASTIEYYLQSYDDSLGETIEDHLECFADHDQLVLNTNNNY
jgi:hypothetical protein